MSFHRTPLVLAATLLATATAHAADAPPAPYTATANVNLVSDYRFRGIDQTWGRPAVQGGADLVFADGFYLGTWLSNVSGDSYPGGSLELDYYGGYNGKVNDDVSFTLGGYGYWYPGANVANAACPSAAFASPCALPSQKLDTFELNAGVTWKWLSYKLSVSTGDYFGANAATGYSGHTGGTLYHDLSGNWNLPGDLALTAHVGRTDVRGTYAGITPDTTDVRVTLARSFAGGWSVSGAVAGANNDAMYRPPLGGLSMANGATRALNKPAFILQVGRSF